jgi:hypothetical protein
MTAAFTEQHAIHQALQENRRAVDAERLENIEKAKNHVVTHAWHTSVVIPLCAQWADNVERGCLGHQPTNNLGQGVSGVTFLENPEVVGFHRSENYRLRSEYFMSFFTCEKASPAFYWTNFVPSFKKALIESTTI